MPATAEPLPEVRESDAPADIAAIYRDFKLSSGNPQINLIYRHLATIPGFLSWAWDVLRPLYRSNGLKHAIDRSVEAVEGDGQGFVAEGSPPAEAEAIRNLLTAYNYGNAQNVIALKSLVTAMQGEIPLRAMPEASGLPPAPLATSVPPLPRLANLAMAQAAIVARMSAAHGMTTAGLIPSMYLHLALWPEVLRHAADRVVVLMTSPDRVRRLRIIDEITSAEASVLATHLSSGQPRLPGDAERKAIAAIGIFASTVIPEMMLVGCTLLDAGRTFQRSPRPMDGRSG